jgi:hypothetical protein
MRRLTKAKHALSIRNQTQSSAAQCAPFHRVVVSLTRPVKDYRTDLFYFANGWCRDCNYPRNLNFNISWNHTRDTCLGLAQNSVHSSPRMRCSWLRRIPSPDTPAPEPHHAAPSSTLSRIFTRSAGAQSNRVGAQFSVKTVVAVFPRSCDQRRHTAKGCLARSNSSALQPLRVAGWSGPNLVTTANVRSTLPSQRAESDRIAIKPYSKRRQEALSLSEMSSRPHGSCVGRGGKQGKMIAVPTFRSGALVDIADHYVNRRPAEDHVRTEKNRRKALRL